MLFTGDKREQIVVAYYRLFVFLSVFYELQLRDQNRDLAASTVPILKSTGFTSPLSLPKYYPFDYFSRCQLVEQQVLSLIECISNNDLYGMMKYYSTDEYKNYLAFNYQANQAY